MKCRRQTPKRQTPKDSALCARRAVCAAVLAFGLCCGAPLFAITAATPPAGYFKLQARPGSDTSLALPLHLRSESSGRVDSVASDRLTIAASGPLDGRYSPSPTGTYYLQFVTGSLAGMTYRIISNTGNEFQLDTAGDDLTNHSLGPIATGLSGNIVRVRRYWTIKDVFGDAPSGWNKLAALPSAIYTEGDAVLLPDNITGGTNGLPALSIFYVTNAGWRAADGGSLDAGSVTFAPGHPFTVRRASPTPSEITVVGYVQQGPFVLALPAIAANAERDVSVASVYPESVTLALSGLSSNAALWSPLVPSLNSRELRDVVLDYSKPRAGFARAADHRFHLIGQDWYENDTAANDRMLQPGVGYVLRFRGAHSKRFWLQLSSF